MDVRGALGPRRCMCLCVNRVMVKVVQLPYLYWGRGVTAEFRVGTHQEEGTWAAHGLTRPGTDASDEVYDEKYSEGADLYVGDSTEQLRTQPILADSSQSVLGLWRNVQAE